MAGRAKTIKLSNNQRARDFCVQINQEAVTGPGPFPFPPVELMTTETYSVAFATQQLPSEKSWWSSRDITTERHNHPLRLG